MNMLEKDSPISIPFSTIHAAVALLLLLLLTGSAYAEDNAEPVLSAESIPIDGGVVNANIGAGNFVDPSGE